MTDTPYPGASTRPGAAADGAARAARGPLAARSTDCGPQAGPRAFPASAGGTRPPRAIVAQALNARVPRSRAASEEANSTGSTGRVTAASARLQVASQASWGRPISSSTGGQWKISSLI